MSENSTNSPNSNGAAPTTKREGIERLISNLKEEGIDVDRMVVVTAASRTIMGMILDPEFGISPPNELVNHPIHLINPKHVLVARQQTQQGIAVQYIIGDLDMVSGGEVQVRAEMGFWLKDLNEDSLFDWLKLYADFLVRKREQAKFNSAMEAGLVVASAGDLPKIGKR